MADADPEVELAKTIVVWSHGSELVTVVMGRMLVTPSSGVSLLILIASLVVVGGAGLDVSGDTVLLLVGDTIDELLDDMPIVVVNDGSFETLVVVELEPVPGMLIVVLIGGSSVMAVLVVVPGITMLVLLAIGGSEDSSLVMGGADVVSLVGGSVSVGVPVSVGVSETVVEIPVPGSTLVEVTDSMLVGVTDEVAF